MISDHKQTPTSYIYWHIASFYLIQHNINELISTTANNSKMNQRQQLFILIRVHIINI